MPERDKPMPEEQPSGGASGGEAERGDAAAPDAPTAEEENQGLGTVLSADPVVGVQRDAGDE